MTMVSVRAFRFHVPTVQTAVGTASANVAITRGGMGTQTLRIVNSGTNTVFIRFGKDSTAAAVLTDTPMLPNTVETFTVQNDFLYVAAISGTAGNTLYITTGEGS